MSSAHSRAERDRLYKQNQPPATPPDPLPHSAHFNNGGRTKSSLPQPQNSALGQSRGKSHSSSKPHQFTQSFQPAHQNGTLSNSTQSRKEQAQQKPNNSQNKQHKHHNSSFPIQTQPFYPQHHPQYHHHSANQPPSQQSRRQPNHFRSNQTHHHQHQHQQRYNSQHNQRSNTPNQPLNNNQQRQLSTQTAQHSEPHSTPHQQQQSYQQPRPSSIPFNKKKNKTSMSSPSFQRLNMAVDSTPEAKLYVHAVLKEDPRQPRKDVKESNPCSETIILQARPDLFSFPNPYEPHHQQPIPDRVWLYNPETGEDDQEDASYTYKSKQLMSGIPLFPSTSQPSSQFTVMSYNVLSSLHISENEYRSTPAGLLSAKFRVPKVFSQIASLRPTFVALQEVDCPFNTYVPLLNSLGYQATFKLRRNFERQISGEGLMLAWDAAEWTCLAQGGVEYSSYPNAPLCKEQLALVALLQQHRSGQIDEDLSIAQPGKHGKNICLVTTHIVFNPKRINIKSAQLQMMLNGVYSWLADLQREHDSETGQDGRTGTDPKLPSEIQIIDGSGEQFSIPLDTSRINPDLAGDAKSTDSLQSQFRHCTLSPTSPTHRPQEHSPEVGAYHTNLLNQFNFTTTDLTSLFRPIIITTAASADSIENRKQIYALEYLLQPDHFLTPTHTTDSTHGVEFAKLDLESGNTTVTNILRLDSRLTIHDIFTPPQLTTQHAPTFTIDQPINPQHLTNATQIPLPEPKSRGQNPNADPAVRHQDELIPGMRNKNQHPSNQSNSNTTAQHILKFHPLNPSNIIRLECVDFNNYTTLARAIHIHSLQSQSQSQPHSNPHLSDPTCPLSPLHPHNRALKKQHVRDINLLLSNAIHCVELRIFIETMKSSSQDPTSYTDHTLFQHLSQSNLLYNNLTQPAGLDALPPPSQPTLPDSNSQLIPLLLQSPTSLAPVKIAVSPNVSMELTRLPPQTTITHKNRPSDSTLKQVHSTPSSFHPQVLLPLHSTALTSRYHGPIRRRRFAGLQKVFGVGNATALATAPNSAVVFTGDFNASVDSSFVAFLANGRDLDISDAIVKSSPTFVGIELEKSAKHMLRDMSYLCHQRLSGAITTAINDLATNPSSQISCQIPPRSHHDFDPEITRSQNDCFIYLITHAFTNGLHQGSGNSKTDNIGEKATGKIDDTLSGLAPSAIKVSRKVKDGDSAGSSGTSQPHENDLLNEQICYAILRELYDFHFTAFTDNVLTLRHTLLSGSGRKAYLNELTKAKAQSGSDPTPNPAPTPKQKSIFQGIAEANAILDAQKGGKKDSSNWGQSPPVANTEPQVDFSSNPLFTILTSILNTKTVGEQDIRNLQSKFTHYVFIRSIFQQFIHQHSATLLSTAPQTDLTISHHCGRSSPQFNSILKSIRAASETNEQVGTEQLSGLSQPHPHPPSPPPFDTEANFDDFLIQLETSFTMTSQHISSHVSELLHTNSIHTAAIRHPLMSLCYHFSTQYTKSFFRQLTTGLPCHSKLFPTSTPPKYQDFPLPINPFDSPLETRLGSMPSPISTMVHPFGPLTLPYQQPYLPRQFRFSSVQERGKTVVDHILVSKHDIPTLLQHTPRQLQQLDQKSTNTERNSEHQCNSMCDFDAPMTTTPPPSNTSSKTPQDSPPLIVHGVLDMVIDEVAVSKKYFLPDTREGSDHLSIMASLQWKE